MVNIATIGRPQIIRWKTITQK